MLSSDAVASPEAIDGADRIQIDALDVRYYRVSRSSQSWRLSWETACETKPSPEESVERTNHGIPDADHITHGLGKRNVVADVESGYFKCFGRRGHKSRLRGRRQVVTTLAKYPGFSPVVFTDRVGERRDLRPTPGFEFRFRFL